MGEEISFKRIAHIQTDFPEKFGIPRQSLLAKTRGKIIFEEPYRSQEAVRGIEQYSHLWLLWEFSESVREEFIPTVRPPRLGGNKRMGVFATRSPFRPNPIGLSCVKLEGVEMGECGPVLIVSGADLMDGTPIYDIKPYLSYIDNRPEASGGFGEECKNYRLDVIFSKDSHKSFAPEELSVLEEILAQDPRPSYQNEPERVYGMTYAGREIKFQVENGTLIVVDTYPAVGK